DGFSLDLERLEDQRRNRQARDDSLGASDEERLSLQLDRDNGSTGQVDRSPAILLEGQFNQARASSRFRLAEDAHEVIPSWRVAFITRNTPRRCGTGAG